MSTEPWATIIDIAATRPSIAKTSLSDLGAAIGRLQYQLERTGAEAEVYAVPFGLAAGDPSLWLALERECGVSPDIRALLGETRRPVSERLAVSR